MTLLYLEPSQDVLTGGVLVTVVDSRWVLLRRLLMHKLSSSAPRMGALTARITSHQDVGAESLHVTDMLMGAPHSAKDFLDDLRGTCGAGAPGGDGQRISDGGPAAPQVRPQGLHVRAHRRRARGQPRGCAEGAHARVFPFSGSRHPGAV